MTDLELIPGGRDIRVTEENKHEYVDKVAEHRVTTTIRPQIESFMEGFNELDLQELISIFNNKELELLISALPEIDCVGGIPPVFVEELQKYLFGGTRKAHTFAHCLSEILHSFWLVAGSTASLPTNV